MVKRKFKNGIKKKSKTLVFKLSLINKVPSPDTAVTIHGTEIKREIIPP